MPLSPYITAFVPLKRSTSGTFTKHTNTAQQPAAHVAHGSPSSLSSERSGMTAGALTRESESS